MLLSVALAALTWADVACNSVADPGAGVDGGTVRNAKPDGGCPPEMAMLWGGTFAMGERGDVVTVNAFCIDRTEVTTDAYAACVGAAKCSEPDSSADCNWHRVAPNNGTGRHPINCVDWTQAGAYCEAQGKRLPTEEEWEWAARGGASGTKYPWGDAAPTKQLCWNRSDSTCEVGSFPSGDNPDGLHDLAGNVAEWTSNPYEGTDCRVVRGGAWGPNNAYGVSAAYRGRAAPTARGAGSGFRCARWCGSTNPD